MAAKLSSLRTIHSNAGLFGRCFHCAKKDVFNASVPSLAVDLWRRFKDISSKSESSHNVLTPLPQRCVEYTKCRNQSELIVITQIGRDELKALFPCALGKLPVAFRQMRWREASVNLRT